VPHLKLFSNALLALYLLLLLWLILFKLSVDFSGVLGHPLRSLNLIPFADYSRANSREMIDNLLAFIPLGVLLGLNLKRTGFWRKLSYLGLLSLVAEATQFGLAIGVSDITDVILNTLGGAVGLLLYGLGRRYVHTEKLDRSIVAVVTALLVVCILLRALVFQVRYHSAPPPGGLGTRAAQRAIPAERSRY